MRALLTTEDLRAGDEKARAALERYTLSLVESAADPAFEEAYAALDAEFGAKGELETRDAILGFFARRAGGELDPPRYVLVVARDEAGEIAGVRDCHVSADATARVVVVFLSHVLVLPAHRRTGLATLLREVPAALGRQRARELTERAPAGPPLDVLLAGEMEPVTSLEETRLRLLVYGRSGFRVIDPRALPYCQPDYRAHALIDADRARPLPLLAVVRWLDHEQASEIPRRLAVAFVEHIYRVALSHCRESDLAAPRAHALAALARHPSDAVPLLAPPSSMDDDAAFAPLSRDAVLAYHPAS